MKTIQRRKVWVMRTMQLKSMSRNSPSTLVQTAPINSATAVNFILAKPEMNGDLAPSFLASWLVPMDGVTPGLRKLPNF